MGFTAFNQQQTWQTPTDLKPGTYTSSAGSTRHAWRLPGSHELTDRLTDRQLSRATLARQMLLAREKATALKAVERLAGMQAQEPKPPFIGLWTRLEGFRREQLVEGLDKRRLVRGTGLRGTLTW